MRALCDARIYDLHWRVSRKCGPPQHLTAFLRVISTPL